MQLNIFTLHKPVIRKEAVSVNMKTPLGEITVLDNHIPLVTPIEKGKVRIIEKGGKENLLEAEGGFIEVRPGSEVNILLD